jgi:hypothetical protein
MVSSKHHVVGDIVNNNPYLDVSLSATTTIYGSVDLDPDGWLEDPCSMSRGCKDRDPSKFHPFDTLQVILVPTGGPVSRLRKVHGSSMTSDQGYGKFQLRF